AGRSPVIMVLSAWGGLNLALWLLPLTLRNRLIIGTAWAAFVAAQSSSPLAWQRYYEPFILMVLVLSVAQLELRDEEIPRGAVVGPIALALLLAAITVASFR